MTPEQCRQARLLLGITVAAVQSVLDAAGATFTDGAVLASSTDLRRLTGHQCRDARCLLGWSQRQLSPAAGVTKPTICSFEARGGKSSSRDVRRADKLRAAFEAAGIEFTDGDSPGVRLRKSES